MPLWIKKLETEYTMAEIGIIGILLDKSSQKVFSNDIMRINYYYNNF